MNQRPLLVLVTGVPGSGKTTLATALRERLGFVLLSRDDFQVRLWNLWQDQPDLLPHVPRAHWAAYYATVDALLDVGLSVLAEGSVHIGRGAAEIAAFLPRADAVVIHCTVPKAVSHERFRVRAGTGRRLHPAYVDTVGGYQPALEDMLEFIWKHGQTQPQNLTPAENQ